jgi:D-inositol-3-phosphate glycosyltransferase
MNVYLLGLAKELGRRGIKVDVFTRVHDPKDPQIVPLGENSRVIHILAGPVDEDKEQLHQFLPDFVQGLLSFTEQHDICYDLLHAHYWYSATAGLALKARCQVPLVTCFHTLAEVKLKYRPGQQESPLRLQAERDAVAQADAIFAFTEEEKGHLVDLYGASSDLVHVVPGGVDMTLFRPLGKREARAKLGIPAGRRVVSYVGRMEPFKGVELLLQSVAALRDRSNLEVLFLGGGSPEEDPAEMASLKRMATEMGIGDVCRFLGSIPQEQLPVYYSASDLCAVPSFYESWGFVAIEAMACGTPVVAMRVGGLAVTVLDGVTGLLVSERQPELWARSIEGLLEDEERRQALGQAGQRWAQRFAWPPVADQVLNVYHSLRVTESAGESEWKWPSSVLGGHSL